MMQHRLSIPFLTGALVVLCASRADAVPEQLGLTARVTDAGTPITGAHTFNVRIFDAATGGTQQWTESDAATAVDGLVYLTLGDQLALDETVLDGGPLWVEIQVDSTVLAPRLAITSAAYAVRAGMAEDSERLGGQPSTAFASATHNHNGTYLPVGATLTCTGTQKVTGLGANGSVVCGADQDTVLNLAGSGLASTAARSDHAHTGTYLPVGGTLACTGTQKMTAINPTTGSVTCGADVDTDTDTNTTYGAGAGLTLTGTTFTPTWPASSSDSGSMNVVARSDHGHDVVCPNSYTKRNRGNQSALCVREVVLPAPNTVNWNGARLDCQNQGARLCTYLEVGYAASAGQPIVSGRWLGDRVGDNIVLRTNGTATDDFDQEENITGGGASLGGHYCCVAGADIN